MNLFSILWLALVSPTLAQDEPPPLTITSARDVKSAVKAQRSDGDIIEAINAGSVAWRPKDVYGLVDAGVPEAVTRVIATSIGLFWDDTLQPLTDISAQARLDSSGETLKINDGNIVELFEWFNDRKYEQEAAGKGVAALAPKGPGELDSAYDQRKRAYDVAKARAEAGPEGVVEASRFEVELSAAYEPFDARTGCGRAKVHASVPTVDYFVFRAAMGVQMNKNGITFKSRTVDSGNFVADADRRIEVYSFPVCMAESAYAAEASKGVKLTATLQRTWEGVWSGQGEFVDKGGSRISARK